MTRAVVELLDKSLRAGATAEHDTVSTIADVTDDEPRAEELRPSRETAGSNAIKYGVSPARHRQRTAQGGLYGGQPVQHRVHVQSRRDLPSVELLTAPTAEIGL